MVEISVITIVWNRREGFERTAESLLAQTYPHFEWIVVDGGSTDGGLDVIKHHAHRMAWWCSEPDNGIYDAMNKGLARASGDYVVFMNAGDRFASPCVLTRVAELIAASPQPPAAVMGGTVMEFPGGKTYYRAPKDPERYLWYSMPAYHQAIYFRTDDHKKVPYDPALKVSADYRAVARLCRNPARCVVVDEPFSCNESGGDSTSHKLFWTKMRDCMAVQRHDLGLGAGAIGLSFLRRTASHLAVTAMSVPVLSTVLERLVRRNTP